MVVAADLLVDVAGAEVKLHVDMGRPLQRAGLNTPRLPRVSTCRIWWTR